MIEPVTSKFPPLPDPPETILVVDDEPDVVSLVADLLRTIGYTVLCAHDPREALRLVRTGVTPLHLLLTDVVMPHMNGRQLVDEVHAIRPGMKVLFMTGLTTDMLESQDILIAPEEPFILKPFTILGLARKVRGVLDGR